VPSATTVSLDREVAKGGMASWILAYAYSHNTLGVVSAALMAISWRLAARLSQEIESSMPVARVGPLSATYETKA
jgi:hypothetical protein